jgi:hypothetical protein
MRKNYRFEILSFLFNCAPSETDIRPLINSMVKEEIFSDLYFEILLEAMRTNDLIKYNDSGLQIKASLQPEGRKEYNRLKLHCVFYSNKIY